jgi:hypothetical protein
VTVDYQFPSTPVTVSGDVNNFTVDFDLIHPVRIDGSKSTVTYSPTGAGVDFTQMPGTCTTTMGMGVCGSDDAISGITLNLAVVPEPASWAMTLLGFGALGAALRSRRDRAAAVA